MDPDDDRIDEVTLALLSPGLHDDGEVVRAWKGFDWGVLDRLHRRGLISNPQSKARSVVMSPEGLELSRVLFRSHFGRA